jgi:hypothetical protein
MPTTDSDDNLALEERGSAFVLVRTEADGSTTEMVLSETNIITLAQSAQRIRDAILARQSSSEATAVALTPVVQVALNTDLHRSEIHLMMIAPSGAQIGFLLPLEVAKPLAERLPVRIAEIEAARPTHH